MRALIDPDRINHVTPRKVGNVAMAVTDAVQDFKSEEQVVGAAAFFILLCRRYRVDAGQMFQVASNVMADDGRPEFSGVSMYLENELS